MRLLKISAVLLCLLPSLAQAYDLLPRNYESLKAPQKQELLWERVVSSEYSYLPNEWPWMFTVLAALNPAQLLARPFQYWSDEMPWAQRKAVHTHGSVGQVEFVPAPNAVVSGMLCGAQGLVRLSSGLDPDDGLVPGMALKFFVDGDASVNLHVMNSLTPQDTYEFFERDFRNVVDVPVIGEFTLSIRRLLETQKDGSSDRAPLRDKIITFVPTQAAVAEYDESQEFRIAFSRMKPVSLYDVYVSDTTNSSLKLVGSLNLKSRLVPSEYGDKMLFFKHDK